MNGCRTLVLWGEKVLEVGYITRLNCTFENIKLVSKVPSLLILKEWWAVPCRVVGQGMTSSIWVQMWELDIKKAECRRSDAFQLWCLSPGGGNGNPPNILDWRIPWTEEAGGVQSMGSQRVRHYWSDLACTHVTQKLHRRTLFFICFVYTSLYLLIPNSEKIKLFKCDNYQQLKHNY